MKRIFSLQTDASALPERVGGKALALARLAARGLPTPTGICLSADFYDEYVEVTGLRERVMLELSRKPFAEMRWEEIWDAALRIRNLFLRTELPTTMREDLRAAIEAAFGDRPTVVRSSAPGEDSVGASFAGLHESYVNVRGVDAVMDHVRLVWASLWSDRALLYRRELGLDVERSAMAVVVQDLIAGERSGVAFSLSPTDARQAVVEAVHGLNQGLVDGAVEPDRWFLSRETRQVSSHFPAKRTQRMAPGAAGVRLEDLPPELRAQPPLSEAEIGRVAGLAFDAEALFGAPQDVEWTMRGETLTAFQSRPITTGAAAEGEEDKRAWYLSLRRSYENLKRLRRRIEDELIPAMIDEARRLGEVDPASLDDAALAVEIHRRSKTHDEWVETYWKEFIPFAHGARLFGQVYNDTMRPDDPFEFTRLLSDDHMLSLERNRALDELADAAARDKAILDRLKHGRWEEAPQNFRKKLESFRERFGAILSEGDEAAELGPKLAALLEQIHRAPRHERPDGAKDSESLRRAFLDRFDKEHRDFAEELLALARASYRLRDDDNLYLGKIEAAKTVALAEGRRRLALARCEMTNAADIEIEMKEAGKLPHRRAESKVGEGDPDTRARQITGQPAGPGLATGPARVVIDPADAFDFQNGEILVCDAVEPQMTFIVPMCAAVVERRGGMLIHGAIVAREYGLPCVTGVPQATTRIRTGDQVTVDGYLGIVTIDHAVTGPSDNRLQQL